MNKSLKDLINKRLEQIKYEGIPTDVECMLNMLDKGHSIVLHNEIGLLGEHDFIIDEDSKKHGVLHIPPKGNGEFEKIERKRGDNFQILDKSGVILFDFLVKHIGILYDKEMENRFYIFVLSDYKSFNELDILLGDVQDAMVLYKNGRLYHNNIKGATEQQLASFDEIVDIKRNRTAYNTYSITINNEIYVSYNICSRANNIWEYHSNPKINL